MPNDNKIGSLTRAWPAQPPNKDNHDKSKLKRNKRVKKNKRIKNVEKDPGDTIIDEYV